MKMHIFSVALFCIISLASKAQLTNTKWKGTANVPNPTESVFEFRKDTLVMTVNSNMVLETMQYKLKGDTLIVTKVEGRSPCQNNSPGYFRITFGEDVFMLTSLKDECPPRAAAFTVAPWVRAKE